MTALSSHSLRVKRSGPTLIPDSSRVLMRPFYPTSDEIASKIVARVMALSDRSVAQFLGRVMDQFGDRHENVKKVFLSRFFEVRKYLNGAWELSEDRQVLTGSYFMHEYSVESVALFNPSIVPHPDQGGLPKGALRFILSLRATGEGHISSITFRVGVLSARNRITLSPRVPFVVEPERIADTPYYKPRFSLKLQEFDVQDDFCQRVLDQLPEVFGLDDLHRVLTAERWKTDPADITIDRASRRILLLAESNYEVKFAPAVQFSQRVIFPFTATQRNGIEDARFLRFENEDGNFTYYATYTAYDGRIIIPQMLETPNFVHFKFSSLHGPGVQNKDMALFPRKIKGHYAMLSRQDDENILIMFSNDIHFWKDPKLLLSPSEPWEFFKMGNCGSPIETKSGWLVLSHGVGPMRKYCIGAFLLDLDDPTRVVGRLREPLLSPIESEREGYVPNVVYTCGALVHGHELVIPFAINDTVTRFATISLKLLLSGMT